MRKQSPEAITLRQVFGANTTQLEVAEALGGLPLTAVAGGSNAALVVIGQPQSGKGHTLFGSGAGKPADAGTSVLVPLKKSHIFTHNWMCCVPAGNEPYILRLCCNMTCQGVHGCTSKSCSSTRSASSKL